MQNKNELHKLFYTKLINETKVWLRQLIYQSNTDIMRNSFPVINIKTKMFRVLNIIM